MSVQCLIFGEPSRRVPTMADPVDTVPRSVPEVFPLCLTSTSCFKNRFDTSHPGRCEVTPHCGSGVSLMTSDAKHLFRYLLATGMSPWNYVCWRTLPISNWVVGGFTCLFVCFSMPSRMRLLPVSDVGPLSGVRFADASLFRGPPSRAGRGVPRCARAFQSDVTPRVCLFVYCLCFCCHIRKVNKCQDQCQGDFFFRSFSVSGLMFKPLIRSELTFVCGVR